ncbi:Ig-like domain-containing protein, partial [Streptomyces turgidiscabies]|uniref:Ig-like domain-containing protein n=1 Tax=Streptomyces turgidiscabies TaxID=85558 RepID=UPI0038F6A8EA
VVGGVALAQQVTILVESPPEVEDVTVSPAEAALLVGQTIALSAEAVDGEGDVVPGATVSWSSSDPDVASVSVSGVVTAEGPGSATITATSN